MHLLVNPFQGRQVPERDHEEGARLLFFFLLLPAIFRCLASRRRRRFLLLFGLLLTRCFASYRFASLSSSRFLADSLFTLIFSCRRSSPTRFAANRLRLFSAFALTLRPDFLPATRPGRLAIDFRFTHSLLFQKAGPLSDPCQNQMPPCPRETEAPPCRPRPQWDGPVTNFPRELYSSPDRPRPPVRSLPVLF